MTHEMRNPATFSGEVLESGYRQLEIATAWRGVGRGCVTKKEYCWDTPLLLRDLSLKTGSSCEKSKSKISRISFLQGVKGSKLYWRSLDKVVQAKLHFCALEGFYLNLVCLYSRERERPASRCSVGTITLVETAASTIPCLPHCSF